MLDRYVYREILPVLVLGVGVFTFLHVMDRIRDFTNMAVSGAPLDVVFRLWLLLMLSFLAHTLPMGFLLAVLVGAGRLAADLEVVALYALGVSPLRLFRPFLTVAAGVALIMAALTWWINPWGYATFLELLGTLQQRAAMPLIQERAFTRIGHLVIYAEEATLATSELRGLLVVDEQDSRALRIVTAPRGWLMGDARDGRTMLRLANGAVHESSVDAPGWYRVTGFATFDTGLDAGAGFRAAQAKSRPDKSMTAWDLVSNTRALEWTRGLDRADMFVVEFHKRLAYPLSPIAFAMVGFPLGIRLQGMGRGVAGVGGIMLLIVYHLLQQGFGGIQLLRPWGGGRWLPVILFLLAGAVLLSFAGKAAPAAWTRAAAHVPALASGWLPLRMLSLDRWRARGTPARHRRLLVDRYLLRQYLGYLGYGLGSAAAVFIVIDLFETLGGYLRTTPPLLSVLEHFVYRVPAALHQALPIVVMTATVFLFMELGRYHELTALKAAGMSLHRISLPVLLLAGALSAGAFVFQETALPVLNARADEVDRVKIRGGAPSAVRTQRDVWYRRSDSEFFRVHLLDHARRQMTGLTVVEIGPDFRLVRRLDVGRVVWAAGGWQFDPGVLRDFGPDSAVRTVSSSRPPASWADSLEALTEPRTPPAAMTFRELRAYVHQLRERGHAVGTWMLHVHAKLAFPLMSLVLALVGIACAARWAQGGRLVGAVIAVTLAIAYWTVNSMALSFGRAELLPPILAAWAANIVFAGIGVALWLRSPT